MIFNSRTASEEEQWAPVSDLMAVLMLVFMFIAIVYIHDAYRKNEATREARAAVEQERVAQEKRAAEEDKRVEEKVRAAVKEERLAEVKQAQNKCSELYKLLDDEFHEDFASSRWNAQLREDLTIRFRNHKVLFAKGSSEISPRFKGILSQFFPRYMKIVDAYESVNKDDTIKEIRIEGHASSEFESAENAEDAYFKNMKLSQDRTRKILQYVLSLDSAKDYIEKAKSRITANGLSSSRIIKMRKTGKENKTRSRRVEFRLLVSSCQKAGRYRDGS